MRGRTASSAVCKQLSLAYLEKELRRKEAALAEAAALLMLKRKADSIWGQAK